MSSFLAFLACYLLQGSFELKVSLQSHTPGASFSWGLGRQCKQEDTLLFLEFLLKPKAPVLLLRWSYFLTCSEKPGKNIQMMVQMVVNTEFWGTADFYYSDCQDLSRKAQGWAVCVPWFYASTYPSVKVYVNNGKVTEHESHLNPTPQIMKLIPKKNDFSKVTERNHGLFGHLSIHPSIQFSIFFIHTSIYQLTHPFIHLFIWPHLPIHPPIIPLIPLSTVPGLV